MKAALKKVIVFGALLAPVHVFAEESISIANPEATKTSPIHNFLPNAYGLVDLRHYNKYEKADEKNQLRADSYLQPRFVLGSKFFSGHLDSKFIFGVNNSFNSGKNNGLIEDKGTRLENDFTVYKHEYFSVVPFLYLEFPKTTDTDSKKKFTKGEIGIDVPVNYPIHTNAGTFVLQAEMIGKTFFGSKTDPESQVDLRNTDNSLVTDSDINGLGLTETEKTSLNLTKDDKNNYKVDPQGRSLFHSFSFGATYKPALVAGLEAQVLSLYETTYTPVMELNKETRSQQARTSSGTFNNTVYSKKFEPSYQFNVKYTFNQQYSIVNEFTLKDKHEGEQKYTNMVSLVAKVF